MSQGGKSKSISKKYDKPRVEARGRMRASSSIAESTKGPVASRPTYSKWERSWKNVKILKYPTRYATELRSGIRRERAQYTVEQVLAATVDTAREFWIPTEEEAAEGLALHI